MDRLTPLVAFILVASWGISTGTGCSGEPEPGSPDHIRSITSGVDDQRLRNADQYPEDWLTHGRTYREQRFSPLSQIDTTNVEDLGLAWSYNLGTQRGLEATPLVVDGILFTTGPWSVVYAFNARTGELIWQYDPEVPRRYAGIACCDVINRGPALYKGKVYVGTLDGRLIAVDATTGELVWETLTVDQDKPYTITGAPRVVDGRVLIGNSGADFGVRGYVSAYDAETGEQVWRTYTVPGNPEDGFESEALEKAAQTWSGPWWKAGGGGTVWDAMAYDPVADLLYVGVGNGFPWNRRQRSPAGGDNLYLSSILALDPATGTIQWHYQTTPGDTWDYTATQHMILADVQMGHRRRPVLIQAPKNGFFYVLNRRTGRFLSAQPYTPVNWALGIDPTTGVPIERPGAAYAEDPARILPSIGGGHNWQPMAYNPKTKLTYIPVIKAPMQIETDPASPLGADVDIKRDSASGQLLAWDPIAQEPVWKAGHPSPWNSGVVTTGGGLVFQGTGDGHLAAYHARTGEKLWSSPLGTGAIGSPISYRVDGRQQVTIMAGWGGSWGLSHAPEGPAADRRPVGRIYTFALGGDAEHPDYERTADRKVHVADRPPSASDQQTQEGRRLYFTHCDRCHGGNYGGPPASGGIIPDLRYSSEQVFSRYEEIVLGGARLEQGMPSFKNRLSPDQVDLIRSYILNQAQKLAATAE